MNAGSDTLEEASRGRETSFRREEERVRGTELVLSFEAGMQWHNGEREERERRLL